jgi:hypothetical protein
MGRPRKANPFSAQRRIDGMERTPTATSPKAAPGRRLRTVLVAAVLVAAGAIGVTHLGSPRSVTSPAPIPEIDAFEAELTIEQPDGATQTWAIRVNHDDYEVRITSQHADGRVQHASVTIVGDETYTVTADGEQIVSPRAPGDGLNPPVADLFRAVSGALANADFVASGTETIAGNPATRYEVELTERSIAAFTNPVPIVAPDVTELTVWIADEHPRQIEMVTAFGYRERLTFLGFGGAAAITVPEGSFTFDPDPEVRLPIELN